MVPVVISAGSADALVSEQRRGEILGIMLTDPVGMRRRQPSTFPDAAIMTATELLAALTDLRTAIASEIRNGKGAGGTVPLAPDNPFVVAASKLGWETSGPATIYTLLKAIEFAHSQISIELFRDGESATANLMLAAVDAESARRAD